MIVRLVDSTTLPTDTETGIMYLRDRFPADKLSLPPLVLQHQLYSIIHNKTTVDRDIVSVGVVVFIVWL